MTENKKIKGAVSVQLDNIVFKSKLERSCFIKLANSGLPFSYESEKIVIWEGKRLTNVQYYLPNPRNRKELRIVTRPLISITYTPDFVIRTGNIVAYVDAKGYANDVYPLKKKMFLKFLEEKHDNYQYIFFEVHSVSQMLDAIRIIQEHESNKSN